MKPRIFVDMDGTLAEFRTLKTLEPLFEKGYFLNLKTIPSVVEAIRRIVNDGEIEVFTLSAVLKDSKYAKEEKNEWLDVVLPEIKKENRLFCYCGENKKEFIEKMVGKRENDFLLDDYTKNLVDWGEHGIKILNGINHTKGTWQGNRLRNSKEGEVLAKQLCDIILRGSLIQETAYKQENETNETLEEWKQFEWERSKAMLKAGFTWEKIQPYSKLKKEAGKFLFDEIEKERQELLEEDWEME